MAGEPATWAEENAAIKRAAKAAYMREYRKKNYERCRVIEKATAARQEAKNPEKFKAALKERGRLYRARKKAAMTPEERAAHNAKNRKKNAAWKARNPERWRELKAANQRSLYARDPEKAKAIVHRRRAQTEDGEVTKEQWAEIVSRFGGCCAYCRRPLKLEMDHVAPLSKGGRHEPGNVVPACRSCNAKKNDQEWPRPEPA